MSIIINDTDNLKKIINSLETAIKNPSDGLPEEIFLFLSRIAPVINVDLLIKNKQNHTLLTWRDDGYFPAGWHIPGGVIRYKETISDRIHAVAKNELGAKIKFKKAPLAINEIMLSALKNRAHSISLLYKCALITPPDRNLKFIKGLPKKGEWAWYKRCPKNLILVHQIYRRFI